MKCQNCQQHEARINIRLQYNHEQHEMKLCSACYQEIQKSKQIPSGFNGGFDHSMGMDHLFQSLLGNQGQNNEQKNQPQPSQRKGGGGFLDQFGYNLTDAARAGLIDPVIGRNAEVERVIEILNRRNKNNPVLIGEPGVGKTAIIEGFALKIAEGDVPDKLKKKEVILLDVASLVSNTGIRGQFEERMKQLISELQQRKNVILFIDELHLIVGAGSAEGSMDAGNILKPALARGELQLVGATTLKEYRDIEKDAALERRFQPVTVLEPNQEEAVKILKGIQSKYEDFHQVKFTDEAITACVHLSSRYIQDRFLPDKAIDLLDEAGSKKNLQAGITSQDDVKQRLTEIEVEKDQALQLENYELAAKLRDEEVKLEKEHSDSTQTKRTKVTVEDIEQIIEKKTGIPVGKIQKNDAAKMKNLAASLAGKVIGQEEAVNKVAKAIRRSRAGLKAKHRPIGSFLFVGPTGVGKTELTKTLAAELFGSKEAMVRLDMSEYMEKHSVSKLIGSPPGYIGHDEAGQLTEKVRRKPYSIILLDEIEKAHPDVQHMFLQILEDGHLTDSQGRKVSFKDTVIIMTSNAGVATKKVEVGFEKGNGAMKEASVLDSLSSFFKPEFLNRFDNIIEFKHLEKEHLIEIVELMINELRHSMASKNVNLEVSQSAKEKLAVLGYHKAFGARPLRRTIQEHLEDKITDIILDEEQVQSIKVDMENDSIIVKFN
ncbi:ATP-dependent Clp protease ATP-binding subunit [Alkalihalobacillus pseudalcaliphilus]|uniref:ATP-dependent Clp protease ATP-binding subunit n=1 Tax=Alkalihalobacillus pseudalcaliphilus TaxID=79884 RepID=UPI00064DCA47|nr:ATP-dependent Clp protease ATP-binding subunit [Alkalihalobacillus pseudalcaliphilus]KMK75596.1 Clp protease ClpX [Alkalihalobacillus pseudalcaliphilus]